MPDETMEKRLRELAEQIVTLQRLGDERGLELQEVKVMEKLRQATDIALEEAATEASHFDADAARAIRSLKTPGEQVGEGK